MAKLSAPRVAKPTSPYRWKRSTTWSSNEALPVSPRAVGEYKSLRHVIRQVFDNPPVAPYVMLGGTDRQHFVPVCDHIYRFTSLVMDESFRGLEHGIDEHIPIQGMARMVKFYAQLMQVWGAKEMAS